MKTKRSAVADKKKCSKCGKELDKRTKSGLCHRDMMIKKNKDPAFIKKVSAGVKKSYIDNPELREQSSKIGKTFGFGSDIHRAAQERNGNWRTQDKITDFEKYTEIVRGTTDKNYQENFYEIPNAKKRGKEFHLDHKVSIAYGFENNIPTYIIGHHKNLEVIHHSLNEGKHTNNSITIDELLLEIDR